MRNVNIETDVNRSGGVAVDVCNDVNIKMMCTGMEG